MRDYELTVLFTGDLGEKDVDKAVKLLTDLLSKIGAKIKSKRDPLKKTLAYEINRKGEGFYVYLEITVPPEKVLDLESKIKMMDNVIRHLLVKSL
jgi:small subunit ribosomal protein S6